jgi:hypothetical protein
LGKPARRLDEPPGRTLEVGGEMEVYWPSPGRGTEFFGGAVAVAVVIRYER